MKGQLVTSLPCTADCCRRAVGHGLVRVPPGVLLVSCLPSFCRTPDTGDGARNVESSAHPRYYTAKKGEEGIRHETKVLLKG